MRVLADTNVVVDIFLERQPFWVDASRVVSAANAGKVRLAVTATSLTNIYYIVRKSGVGQVPDPRALARKSIEFCLIQFDILLVDRPDIEAAYQMPGKDFEDNIQIACAISGKMNAIVTRDAKDFAASAIPVLTPSELLIQLNGK